MRELKLLLNNVYRSGRGVSYLSKVLIAPLEGSS